MRITHSVMIGAVIALVVVVGAAAQTLEPLPISPGSPRMLGDDPGPPDAVFCVRVAGLPTSASARQACERLEEMGFSHVESISDGSIHAVIAGAFEFEVDAELCAEDLRRGVFHRVTVARLASAEALRVATSRHLPITPVFHLEAENVAQAADPQIDMEGDPLMQSMWENFERRDAVGDAELARMAESLSESDPRRTRVLLTMAHRANWQRDWEGALEMYLAVADGFTPVRRHDRINAMINVGWLYEYRIGDRRAAYRANRELELFTDSEAIRARARTEQAWVMFEMVRYDGLGSWDDVRRLCAQTIAQANAPVPLEDQEDFAKWIAVSQLIHLETFHYEDNWEAVIRYTDAYLAEHGQTPARRREVGMARTWLGIAHTNLMHFDEARGVFEDIIEMELGPGEFFAGENVERLAAEWLFHVAELETDLEGMRLWAEYLNDTYPGTEAAAYALRRLTRFTAGGN